MFQGVKSREFNGDIHFYDFSKFYQNAWK